MNDSRLGLSAAELAKALGVSGRHVWTLLAQNKLPAPVRLGRSVRWNLAEIAAWLNAGAPPREEWEQMKAAGE